VCTLAKIFRYALSLGLLTILTAISIPSTSIAATHGKPTFLLQSHDREPLPQIWIPSAVQRFPAERHPPRENAKTVTSISNVISNFNYTQLRRPPKCRGVRPRLTRSFSVLAISSPYPDGDAKPRLS
jgi:hypothetical protein